MKKIYGIIFIVMMSMSGFGQALNWTWAKSAGAAYNDRANSCTTDASGNIIVAGNFGSPNIIFGTDTLINGGAAGLADMFIVKYDSTGNVLWAKCAGGTNHDWGTSCCTDAAGNIIVTGRFYSSNIPSTR